MHTDVNTFHWWKAIFKQRVFITSIRFVNREHGSFYYKSDNIDIVTNLYQEGGSMQSTVCTNTGDMGSEITLQCQQQADEIILQKESNVIMNLAEIEFNGNIIYDF